MKQLMILCSTVLAFASGNALARSQPKDVMSEAEAKRIALIDSPGIVLSSELEYERKQWVYSFDIRGADAQVHEILINAKTGKIIERSIESAQKEAAEAQDEKSGNGGNNETEKD